MKKYLFASAILFTMGFSIFGNFSIQFAYADIAHPSSSIAPIVSSVEVNPPSFHPSDSGSVFIGYVLDHQATSAKVEFLDRSGKIVDTIYNICTSGGLDAVAWDGHFSTPCETKSAVHPPLPVGTYTIRVSATNSNNLTGTATTTATITNGPTDTWIYHDVNSKSPYYDALIYSKAKSIIPGNADGHFYPNHLVDRTYFTYNVVEASHTFPYNGSSCMQTYAQISADGDYAKVFKDVFTKNYKGFLIQQYDEYLDWYLEYLCYAKSHHLVDGYPDGTFRPLEKVSFVEAAKIIFNTFHEKDATLASNVSEPWYFAYVEYLALKKAIPTTITKLDQKITRGEMAEMIYRIKTANTAKSSQGIAIDGDEVLIIPYGSKY